MAMVMQYTGFAQPDYKHIRVSEDIELIQLSENAFVHVSYSELPGYGRISSNGLVFISGKEAFLFDTPATDILTKELVTWLADSMKLKIVGFVPNHWHGDCMGRLSFLQDQGDYVLRQPNDY